MKTTYKIFIGAALLAVTALATTAYANHSWGGYHWARTANPFTLTLGDNLSPSWDPYLAIAASDWSSSTVLDLATLHAADSSRARSLGE